MKLIRKWALVLCLASLFTSYSNSQQTGTELVPGTVYTTGNIVQPTVTGGGSPWTGAVYQDQLTCWAGGDPGYCGPNAVVRPGNYINFSYGSTYVYQQQNINAVVPSGSGLQVNGYNFGFTAKNGNGWDDGRTDNLMALVRFWDNTGGRGTTNLLYGNVYDLNYKFNWTQFNYSENFATPLPVPNIGQVQYGFIGKDNNFWQGPYGPELMNISFSVKYSVDPCATNPLYSPTCAGYLAALAKLAPAATSTPLAETTAVAAANETEILPPPPPGAPPPEGPGTAGPPLPPGTPGSAGGPPAASSPTVAPPPPPAAGGAQPRVGETQTASGGSKAGPSLGTVLSMISANQDRIGNEAKSVVSAAESAAAQSAQSAQQQAESVAGDLTAQSIANSTANTSGSGGSTGPATSSQSSGASVALLSATQTTVGKVDILRAPTQISSTDTATLSASSSAFAPPTPPTAVNTPVVSAGTVNQSSQYELFTLRGPTTEVEIPQFEGIKLGSRSTLMDAIESQQLVTQDALQTQSTSTVNRNVQSNELAGGIDVAQMATQPVGYQAYAVAMPDASFYAPREIYRNQVNVDNVRLLRGLASDKLHQDLVNLQYK